VKIKAVLVIVCHHPQLLHQQQHRLNQIRGKKDFEGKRSSEASLKLVAISRSFVTVTANCSANCSVNGNCLKTLNMLDVLSEMVGELNATTTQSTSERRSKIIDKMRKSISRAA
jgi:hypothetical protein